MDITSIQSKHSEEVSHMRIEALQEVEKLRLVHEVEVRSVMCTTVLLGHVCCVSVLYMRLVIYMFYLLIITVRLYI